jgi:hypothetical protein
LGIDARINVGLHLLIRWFSQWGLECRLSLARVHRICRA